MSPSASAGVPTRLERIDPLLDVGRLVIASMRPVSVCSIEITPSRSARTAAPFGARASNSSSTRGRPVVMSARATPPVWNVRIVSCVPGSPIDCAAMMPTPRPCSTSLPLARLRP